MGCCVELPIADWISSRDHLRRLFVDPIDHHFHLIPPRRESAFGRSNLHLHCANRLFTAEVDAQVISLLIGKADAVIQVQRTLALFAGINPQLKWSFRLLCRVLYDRLLRDNCPAAYEDRWRVQRRGELDRTSWDFLTCPVVVPGTWRNIDLQGIKHFSHPWRNQQIASKE